MPGRKQVRKGKLLGLLVMLFMFSNAVVAQSPNYNLAEVGTIRIDPDSGSNENGWFVGGSFQLKKKFHLFIEFAELDPSEQWQVGGGWHGLFGKRADLVVQGAWVDTDFEDGFKASIGIRGMVLRRLEINGFINYTDLDFSENNSISVHGIWDFARRFGVGGGYEFGNEFDVLRGFVRFNLGPRQ
jgi:hypothetical protein